MASDSLATDVTRQTIDYHVHQVTRIASEVASGASAWSDHVQTATHAVDFFNSHPGFDDMPRQAKINILTILQQVAYHRPTQTPVHVVADWCTSHWLRLCEENGEDADALLGMALSWLYRAQAVLHKIYESDRRSSSSSSASEGYARALDRERKSIDGVLSTYGDGKSLSRTNSAEYIEARTCLQPATEYFDRAITISARHGTPDEEMLLRAAEANISLGNTTSSRTNERFYRRAIELLRQSADAGYTLTPSLKAFLDEYGRFVD